MRAIPLVFLLVTGCMGQIGSTTPGDDNPPGDAKSIFVSEVQPIVAKCQGVACHSIDATSSALAHWYSPTANTTYTAITAARPTTGEFNSIAPILTKIDAGHQGISYSTSERTSIIDWLSAESTERQGSGPPPVDPTVLLGQWSGCMSQANFDTALMATKFGNSNASNGQACKNCHGSSAFGFTTSPDSVPYFEAISKSQSQLLKYFSVQAGGVVINMASLTNAGSAIVGHPPFDPTVLVGMPALQSFYDLTKSAVTAAGAAGCGPTKITLP